MIEDFDPNSLKPLLFFANKFNKTIELADETLANTLTIVFSPFNNFADRMKIKWQQDLDNYKESIRTEVNKIPLENVIEPPLSLIGPALEASKYYINDDEIRDMFAKLIAASMDSSKSSLSHISFVEIIKQLSPLDAQNLKSFGNIANLPIVNYINSVQTSGSALLMANVFLENENCNDLSQIAISISNLQRLGIVELTFDGSYLSGDAYKKHEQHEFYIEYKAIFESANSTELPDYYMPIPKIEIEIQKGIIKLTPLGEALKRVCIG